MAKIINKNVINDNPYTDKFINVFINEFFPRVSVFIFNIPSLRFLRTINTFIIPSDITEEMIINFLKNKNAEPTALGINKTTKEPIVLKKGRFGPYLQCGKKMKSIPPGINENNITESIAEDVINMPYEIGKHPETNDPIMKDIGRYGPDIKCGSKNRKISVLINLFLSSAR